MNDQTTNNDVIIMNAPAINTTGQTTQNQPDSNKSAIKVFNMEFYFKHLFKTDVENFKKSGKLKSGYANIDAITNLYPGLYVIGAISSLGKTTFIHQMCDQLAEFGNPVLFISLEQSTLELASKSIARTIAKENTEKGLSSLQIRRADLSDPIIASAISRYTAYSRNITIVECSFKATIDDITNTIHEFVRCNNIKPIVVIDYLQVIQTLPDARMTTKDTVDYHVTRLKEIQTDYQLTMFVISSLNRQNYMTAIDFESFKESGGIEYTADVVWGLQLQCIHEDTFSKANQINKKRQRIKEAKREVPRKIELVCLKNRFGISSYSCYFDYYAKYDLFKPDNTKTNIKDIADNNVDTDGFMTLPPELDAELPWDIKTS